VRHLPEKQHDLIVPERHAPSVNLYNRKTAHPAPIGGSRRSTMSTLLCHDCRRERQTGRCGKRHWPSSLGIVVTAAMRPSLPSLRVIRCPQEDKTTLTKRRRIARRDLCALECKSVARPIGPSQAPEKARLIRLAQEGIVAKTGEEHVVLLRLRRESKTREAYFSVKEFEGPPVSLPKGLYRCPARKPPVICRTILVLPEQTVESFDLAPRVV